MFNINVPVGYLLVMDKLKMHTQNIADDKFASLVAMFPNALTETIYENGEVVRTIDAEV